MPGQIFPNYEAPTANIQGTPVAPSLPTDGEILIYSGPANAYIPGDPIVSGPDPVGSPPTVNPVQIGGEGPDGNVHEIQTDLTGKIEIDAAQLLDLWRQVLYELRAIKAAIIGLDLTLNENELEAEAFAEDSKKVLR